MKAKYESCQVYMSITWNWLTLISNKKSIQDRNFYKESEWAKHLQETMEKLFFRKFYTASLWKHKQKTAKMFSKKVHSQQTFRRVNEGK